VYAVCLPRGFVPKEACQQGRHDRSAGLQFMPRKPVTVHPMNEYRRVPLSMLRKRLRAEEYEAETPFQARISRPTPRLGRRSSASRPGGRSRGRWGTGRLRHARIDGRARRITQEHIEITASADVDVILSRSICSGMYVVMARVEVGAVRAAVSSGNTAAVSR